MEVKYKKIYFSFFPLKVRLSRHVYEKNFVAFEYQVNPTVTFALLVQ
jgi:hypothetical protein